MKKSIFKANPSLDCYFETSDGNAFYTENAAKSYAKDLDDKKVKTIYKEDFVDDEEPSELVAPEMKIVSDDTQNTSEPVEPVVTTEPVTDLTGTEQKTESVELVATTEPVVTTEKVEAKATTTVAETVKPNTKK